MKRNKVNSTLRPRDIRSSNTNPHYPEDEFLHRDYQRIIGQWMDKIDRDDVNNYSTWNIQPSMLFRYNECYNMVSLLVQNPCFQKSEYGNRTVEDLISQVHRDRGSRRELHILLMESFIYQIERTDDKWIRKQLGITTRSEKRDLIDLFLFVNKYDCNPFDLLYLMGTNRFIRNQKIEWVVKFSMGLLLLIFLVFSCEYDIDF